MNFLQKHQKLTIFTIIFLTIILLLPYLLKANPVSEIDNTNHGSIFHQNEIKPSFIRQDPLPDNLRDVLIYHSNHKGVLFKVTFPDVFNYEIATGPKDEPYRRYKANKEFKIVSSPGEPEILHRLVWIQVPTDAKNISISVNKQIVKGQNPLENISLYPIPNIEFYQRPDGHDTYREVFTINEETYSKDTWLPSAKAQIIETGTKHGLKLIRVAIPIMQYNPKFSLIQEIKESWIKVNYTTNLPKNTIDIDTQQNPFHQIFNSIIPNYAYNDIQNYIQKGSVVEIRGSDLTNPDWASINGIYPNYLVIAAEVFDEQAREPLQTWANYRATEEGGNHDIAIAYVHDIADFYSQNLLEEKIKSFIQMAYENWRPDPAGSPSIHFLLLVGDADQEGSIYPWFLPTWRSSIDATDTGDNDYVWLEGDDTLNDVLIGRLPAKSEQELLVMVEKITEYFEQDPPSKENHYGTRSLMLYADWPGHKNVSTPADFSNRIRLAMLGAKQEIDESHTEYLKNLPFFKYDGEKIADLINNKGYLFIGYMGHGATFHWLSIHDVNIAHLENKHQLPAIILSNACHTAGFDVGGGQDSYGEQWLKHSEGGSVSFFGATRPATIVGFSEIFMEAVYKNNIYVLGAATNMILTNFKDIVPNSATLVRNRKIHVLLGDPAVNFSNHIAESTKPDLVIKQTSYAPKFPTHMNQPMTVTYKAFNNSSQALTNIPIRLFSIDAGQFIDFKEPWTIDLLPKAGKIESFPWNYQGHSSRHFMAWIDPDDTIEELSKFNNWLNSSIAYFPIHVDAYTQTPSQNQHGTQQEPFKDLATAVSIAFDPSIDLIGEEYRPDPQKAIEIILAKGFYGQGNILNCNSVFLSGKDGARKTVVFDQININGPAYKVEDITFDGIKLNNSMLRINPQLAQGDQTRSIKRNIFKRSKGYALKLDHSGPLMFSHRLHHHLKNNIFHDNHGTIWLDSGSALPILWLTNNTFTKNQNNLFLIPSSHTSSNFRLTVHWRNNIIWNTGTTNGSGTFPNNIYTNIYFNNINDITLWDTFGASPEPEDGNIEADPRFKDSDKNNFTLKANSPSLNAGDPHSYYSNPDGSRNDQGAFGGPQAEIPPIRITNPVHGETIPMNDQNSINIVFRWKTHNITPPGSYVEITMYHYELDPNAPHRGINTPHYHLKKIIDIDRALVPNIGVYDLYHLYQEEDSQSYYLKISDPNDPAKHEIINFTVSQNIYDIKTNR